MKRRILQIVPTLHRAGAEKQLSLLSCSLAAGSSRFRPYHARQQAARGCVQRAPGRGSSGFRLLQSVGGTESPRLLSETERAQHRVCPGLGMPPPGLPQTNTAGSLLRPKRHDPLRVRLQARPLDQVDAIRDRGHHRIEALADRFWLAGEIHDQ